MWLLYALAVLPLTIAGLAVLFAEARFGAVEAAVIGGSLTLLWLPLALPPLVRRWANGRRAGLGYPDGASDLDLVEFVGEEVGHAGYQVEWRGRFFRPERLDSFQTAGDGPTIIVSVAWGILSVDAPGEGVTRFVDPVAAADHAVAACRRTLPAFATAP